MKPPPQRRAPTGLTLIELLVTLTVLAILATIATPSLTDLIRSNRVTSQTNELVAVFHLARTEAVRRNPLEDQFVLVTLDSHDNGWSASVLPPSECGTNEDCPENAIRCLGRENVSIVPEENEIRFNNRGYLVDSDGLLETQVAALTVQHVNSTNPRHTRCISITPTGQVTTNPGSC